MKKRLISFVLMFLLVLSAFTFAQADSSDTCSGFCGSIKCFLFGSAENRAGAGWFDREGALVGKE